MGRKQKRKLLIIMEIRWRCIAHRRKKVHRMIKSGIPLLSAKLIREYNRLEKHVDIIMKLKNRFESETGEKIIFYGIANLLAYNSESNT